MKSGIVNLLFFLCTAVVLSEGMSIAADNDPCTRSGIIVSNGTMLDLWYKKNNSACSILIHEHLFTIKTDDMVKVYSDMECRTLYCPVNPTYKDYKSVDANDDCGVRILQDCDLSDM